MVTVYPVFDVRTLPRVDIDFMNRTHLEEVELVNQVGDMMQRWQSASSNASGSVRSIETLLDHWLEHARAHFARENALMQEYAFPALAVHAEEHRAALALLQERVSDWRRGHDFEPLERFVFHRWPKWFNNHVITMDMMTARYVVMNGYHPYLSEDPV